MASPNDSVIVDDEERLKRFVARRDVGDVAGARREWEALIEADFDRIAGLVALQARGKLSAHERDEAVQRAIVRVWRNMISTFAGTSVGEWINAVRTCAGFAVADVQREAARRSERETALEAAAEYRWSAVAGQEHRREAERADARGFVEWSLPQMRNARQRLVVERSLDGVPAEEIAAELAVSLPNLYQLRSRGLKDLAKLKELYDA